MSSKEIGNRANPDKIHGSTALVNTIAMIRWWLDRCEKGHMACAVSHHMRGTQRLPTRLIDLGSGLDAALILCKGSELPPQTEYVSLSHCWGTCDPIKLTSQNIAEMEAAIPTEALSRTFRDAITTTWELGFRYLWIDFLCIMQDSTDDRRCEAALMKNIYQKATINIAATASSDGRGDYFMSGIQSSSRRTQSKLPGMGCAKVNTTFSIETCGKMMSLMTL